MSFVSEHICLNIYYGYILLHFGLEGVKIHTIKKTFFLYPSLTNFKIIGLVVFQQLRKLYLEWKRGGGKFVSFLSLFLYFQDKCNPHISLFIITVDLFFSIALLIFFFFFFICKLTVSFFFSFFLYIY